MVPNSGNFDKNGLREITILNQLWNCPWMSGEVLQCPGFFHLCIHLLKVLEFLVIIRSLQHSQATFGTKFKKKYLKNYWTLSRWIYHSGTAPGRAGQCCSALAFSIVYACACSELHFFAVNKIFFAIVFCTFWYKKTSRLYMKKIL